MRGGSGRWVHPIFIVSANLPELSIAAVAVAGGVKMEYLWPQPLPPKRLKMLPPPKGLNSKQPRAQYGGSGSSDGVV